MGKIMKFNSFLIKMRDAREFSQATYDVVHEHHHYDKYPLKQSLGLLYRQIMQDRKEGFFPGNVGPIESSTTMESSSKSPELSPSQDQNIPHAMRIEHMVKYAKFLRRSRQNNQRLNEQIRRTRKSAESLLSGTLNKMYASRADGHFQVCLRPGVKDTVASVLYLNIGFKILFHASDSRYDDLPSALQPSPGVINVFKAQTNSIYHEAAVKHGWPLTVNLLYEVMETFQHDGMEKLDAILKEMVSRHLTSEKLTPMEENDAILSTLSDIEDDLNELQRTS
jgi:hypothetical protein